MSKSALVKIGLPSEQAEGQRLVRRVRQLVDQQDAAFARLAADFKARMRAIVEEETGASAPTADEPEREAVAAAVPDSTH